MEADKLRSTLPAHVGGIYLAAAQILKLIDSPDMTIAALRGASCTGVFREQIRTFNYWFAAAVTADAALSIEQKRDLLTAMQVHE